MAVFFYAVCWSTPWSRNVEKHKFVPSQIKYRATRCGLLWNLIQERDPLCPTMEAPSSRSLGSTSKWSHSVWYETLSFPGVLCHLHSFVRHKYFCTNVEVLFKTFSAPAFVRTFLLYFNIRCVCRKHWNLTWIDLKIFFISFFFTQAKL